MDCYKTTIVQTAQWVIARHSKSPDRATIKFLTKRYYDEEVANLLAWGIEDKHYQVVDKENRIIGYPPGMITLSAAANALMVSIPKKGEQSSFTPLHPTQPRKPAD